MTTINQALDTLQKACRDYNITETLSSDLSRYETLITIRIPYGTPLNKEIEGTKPSLPSSMVTSYKDPLFSKNYMIPEVREIRYNGPATIVFWKDGTKTVVKIQPGEICYDPDKAFAMAVCKKLFGNKFNRHLTEAQKAFKKCYEEECEKECIRFDNLITMVRDMFNPSANSDSEDKKED